MKKQLSKTAEALRAAEAREAAIHNAHLDVVMAGGQLAPPCPRCEAFVTRAKKHMEEEDARRRAEMVCEAKRLAESRCCNVVGCRVDATLAIVVGGARFTTAIMLCGEHAVQLRASMAAMLA